ncbi:MAG: hypothetical protein QHH06_00900 [Clostridiales bacterium]|nr:hypothetical protein [Eubacteriales bacterium]MDH7565029.1 hypothetical protein [Clostridiales bacterium]
MSIKPVDFQVMFPKIMEVSKLSNDEQQKNQVLQQQQSSLVEQKADNDTKQVHTREKLQEARIRDKQEKEQQERKKEEKKRDKNDNSKNKDLKLENKTGTIDIRL